MAKRQKFELGMTSDDLSKSQLEFDLKEINSIKVDLLSLIHCPITLDPIKEPVITPQGIIFEKEAILTWIEENGTCPLTRQALTRKQIKAFNVKAGSKRTRKIKS